MPGCPGSGDEIEVTTGWSARELFAGLGELAIGQLESEVLAGARQRSQIIQAAGGAAIDLENNQPALANSTGSLIVFLDAPFQV